MADLTSGADGRETSRAGMDYTPPPRIGAFKAADRHTARVRFLRRAIILGAALAVSIIAIVAIFDPLRHLPSAVSLAGVGVNGTKITMDRPKISGVQQGGGPYDIKAPTGIQDVLTPSVIELGGVDATVGMAALTTTHILSTNGLYDSKADTMGLSGDVRIANTSGYTLNMSKATMDFKAGVLSSHERLHVDIRGGQVSADDLAISNNGHVVAFRGNIASTFDPPPDDAASKTADIEGAAPR